MNKNSRVILYFIFVSVVAINITTLINGIQKHETWRIVVGSISLALMLVAAVLTFISYKKNKGQQVS